MPEEEQPTSPQQPEPPKAPEVVPDFPYFYDELPRQKSQIDIREINAKSSESNKQ